MSCSFTPSPSDRHHVVIFFLQVNLTWTSLIITRKNFILHPKALSFTQTETPINWQTLIANYSTGFEKSWNQFKTTTRNISLKKMRQDLFAPFWLALITHSLPFTLFQLLYINHFVMSTMLMLVLFFAHMHGWNYPLFLSGGAYQFHSAVFNVSPIDPEWIGTMIYNKTE